MNIKSLKSKILLAGIIFMLVGTTVGLIGLGMTGFEPDRLMKWKEADGTRPLIIRTGTSG